MKVLIAEDNELQSKVLAELLKDEGVECTIVENGKEALKILPDQFDLIVSDMSMPVMDGYQLAQSVKDDPDMSKIPFVMYSSRPTRMAIELAYEIGVDKFVEEAGIRGVTPAVMHILKSRQ